MPERRTALKIIGSVGATCAFPFAADELYAQHEHTHAGVTGQAKLPEPSYFKKNELADIAAIAQCIIPATDTPGAIEAGVPAYIDFVVSRNKDQQKLFAEGLEWLALRTKKEPFAGLSEAAKLAILEPLCRAADERQLDRPEVRFFAAVKALTADGFWTSYAGMGQTLGFKSNAILGAYPECAHEH